MRVSWDGVTILIEKKGKKGLAQATELVMPWISTSCPVLGLYLKGLLVVSTPSITSSALLSVLKARYTERGSALHRYNGDPVSGWRDRTAASYVRGKKTETIQIIPRFPVK